MYCTKACSWLKPNISRWGLLLGCVNTCNDQGIGDLDVPLYLHTEGFNYGSRTIGWTSESNACHRVWGNHDGVASSYANNTRGTGSQHPEVTTVLCWSRAPNLGICARTLVPRSPGTSFLCWGGWDVFYDKYPTVEYFHPINLYFHFKEAHVGNFKPFSSTQG